MIPRLRLWCARKAEERTRVRWPGRDRSHLDPRSLAPRLEHSDAPVVAEISAVNQLRILGHEPSRLDVFAFAIAQGDALRN